MAGSVLVVRHALSTWNAESRWAGQADPPLAVAGTAQARRLGRLLLHARRRPTAVVASDLRRAADTARVAGALLGLAPPTLDARLRERRAAWSGLTTDEIERRSPGALARWRSGRSRDLPGASEPWAAFSRRVLAALRERAASEGDWLVVTHSGAFRVLEAMCGVPHRPRANTAGVRLHLVGGDLRPAA